MRVSPSARVPIIVALITTIGCLIAPLFAVHGVESALGLGLTLPPFVSAMACRVLLGRGDRTIGSALREAGRSAAIVLAIPFFGLMLGALRARWCAPLEGLAFFALGPLVGTALAIGTGSLIGVMRGRARWLG